MTKLKPSSRRAFLNGAAAVGLSAALPARASTPVQRRIVLNDASRLSPTPVFRHWVTQENNEATFLAALRNELKTARELRRPVAVGAARHSMGGQSLARNGTVLTFDVNMIEPDRAARTFRVNGGTRWHEVIANLDKIGFSPVVMQSNSDFGVAATFCVNAHGWPAPHGPFGATVRSLRLMLASSEVVRCSRTENAELFQLCMGGYGLLGVIVDLEVDMVENSLMAPRYDMMPAEQLAERFVRALRDEPDVRMIYGRLNVTRGSFFRQALLATWRPRPTPAAGLPRADRGGGMMSNLSRHIYRAQIGSETGKDMRWWAESVAGPKASSGIATRNSLMNEPVLNLDNRDHRRTDILHEYFVAPERFNEFISACREIIPKARAEFLNVTLRYVARDQESILSYATTDRIAAVMSFSQEISDEGEADMIRVTEALIDRVAAIGGSYYLPYRPHARPDQMRAIYPNTERFVALKRRYDPDLLFRNGLWDNYFAS
jgi:FAD/FMN-containing dehydrogenase